VVVLAAVQTEGKPVDVQEDLAQELSENRRNHKVAIIEERNHGIEPAPRSDRLRDQAFANQGGSPDRDLWRKGSYHVDKKDARLPVPN